MWKGKGAVVECFLILLTCCLSRCVNVHAEGGVRAWGSGPDVVKKEERWPVVSTEYGHISAVRVSDGINGSYLLHFFSLQPNSLLLPLLLNADMLFYVKAGNGRLSWSEEDEVKHIDLRRGDVYRLVQGTVFYMLSDELAQAEQQGLKIHAIFPNSNDDLREPTTGPYSSVQQMVLAFDRNILQATFKVSEEVIDELLGGTKPPAITRIDQFCRGFSESRSCDLLAMNKKKDKEDDKEKEKKKKKEKEKDKDKKETRLFNLFEEKKKIENCNGWSTTVTEKQLPALEGSNIGLFMVNLTAGSMMEPHWNTMDAEIVVVLQGRGMVRVCSPSITKEKAQGRSRRFEVEEGDVFAVPRFHPAAEMAFNNGSFVFMGFSRMTEESKAEFIAGESSVLQLLNKDVLQLLFNIKRATLDEILAPRHDSFISSCTSCAEEEMQSMHEGGGGEAYHPRRGEEGRREREESPHRGGREEEERRRQEEREEGQRRRQEEREERRQEEREEGMRTEEERRRGREERRWEEGEEEARQRGREQQRWEEGEEEARQRGREQQEKINHLHYEQGGRRILNRI